MFPSNWIHWERIALLISETKKKVKAERKNNCMGLTFCCGLNGT
jgi:hypothetical protein